MKQSLIRYIAPGLTWLLALPALAQQIPITPTPQQIVPRQSLTVDQVLRIVVTVANVMLAFIGVIAVIMILAGAFYYVTGGSNEETLKKGKNLIIYGLVGVAIATLAFAIVGFVNNFLQRATV